MAVLTLATWTHNDTRALWVVTILDSSNNNAALDISTMTLKLYMRPVGGATLAAITGTIVDGPNGKVRFDCRTVAAAGVGQYRGQIQITDASLEVQRTADFYHMVKEAL